MTVSLRTQAACQRSVEREARMSFARFNPNSIVAMLDEHIAHCVELQSALRLGESGSQEWRVCRETALALGLCQSLGD